MRYYFATQIFTILIEYLKSKASGGIYLNLMKQLKNTARILNVNFSPDFGAKPVVKRFTIVETAVAAGSFKVSLFSIFTRCSFSSYLLL